MIVICTHFYVTHTHTQTHLLCTLIKKEEPTSPLGCSLTYTIPAHMHTEHQEVKHGKAKVTLGISVVGVRYAAESLLAGCIPDLHVKAHNYTAANAGNLLNNLTAK